MISEHDEIEAKLAAGGPGGNYIVNVDEFKAYIFENYDVERYEVIAGPDDYWENGPNVVRHRKDRRDGRHELTVKRRKSEGSTRDRLEVDLHFAKRTREHDVEVFLKATGFTHVFTLFKRAHIFWVRLSPRLEATFVIYDVQVQGDPSTNRRFIEIEAEKGSPISPDRAKRHVNQCVVELRLKFKLEEPLNESLWEIYSGKRYQKA